jgi:WD40 repeat protein
MSLCLISHGILLGSDDGTVRIWEVSTGRCLGIFNLGKKAQQQATPETGGDESDADNSDDDNEPDDENVVSDSEIESSAQKSRNSTEKAVIIMSVNWNPNPAIPVLAVAVYDTSITVAGVPYQMVY